MANPNLQVPVGTVGTETVEGVSGFLAIPELVRNKILSYLKHRPTYLLNLRAVCSTTKEWIAEYPGQEKSFQGFQIKIEEIGDHTLKNLMEMEMGIKITNFYFNVQHEDSSNWFKRIPCLEEFLGAYGPIIKKLKLPLFNCCIQDYEFQFFQKLTALEELDLVAIRGAQYSDSLERSRPIMRIPENLSNLKALKLRFGGNSIAWLLHEEPYVWKIINSCTNLEILWIPCLAPASPRSQLQKVMEYIRNRTISQPDKPNLLYINMKYLFGVDMNRLRKSRNLRSFVFDHSCSRLFAEFAALCAEMNIKLLNVDASLLDMIGIDYSGSQMIVSLVNINLRVPRLQLPNLEKLRISSTSAALSQGIVGELLRFQSVWRNLKTLSIHCDCTSEEIQTWEPKLVIYFLRDPIFVRNLNHLKKFKFVGCRTCNCYVNAPGNTLHLWWKSLSNLEELCIENCLPLEFAYGAMRDRVEWIGFGFLTLVNLKKLTLKLDPNDRVRMTDRCFQEVFRHLKLKEFNLISNGPLKNVTLKGIASLLDGEFANSIEKFPFKTWSLANTSVEQLLELQKQFRSVRCMMNDPSCF